MDLSRSRKRSRSNMVPSLGNRASCRQASALLADHLRHAAATFYGTAGRAFLAKLVATRAGDPDGFYELVKGLRQQFISDHLPAGSDGQVRSVAGRFGVVAAAGELATEWGILPWEIGEATQAAAICFRAWLTERGGIGAGEVQAAIRQVRAFFEQHGAVALSRNTGRTADHQSLRLAATRWRRLGVSRPARGVEIRGLSRN